MRRTLRAALEESAATIGTVDARVLLCDALEVDRAYLATHPMRVLTEAEDAKVDTLVARRAMGHPVAYIVGTREFYGRDFEVGPDVLIPRPETETLVEAALARIPRGGTCADLGTGSGAIAVTLACERPDLAWTATDASDAALAVAARNAARHGCAGRIELVRGEWYAPLEARRFDAVVGNPPYVAAHDAHLGRGDLRFEPHAALTDGSADGLDSLRAIVRGAPGHLRPGGWLLLEHGYDQASAVRELLEHAGFTDFVAIDDLAGIPRVAGGKIA